MRFIGVLIQLFILLLKGTAIAATPPAYQVSYLIEQDRAKTLAEVSHSASWEPSDDAPIRIKPGTSVWFRIETNLANNEALFIEHPWNMALKSARLYYNGHALEPLRKYASLFTVTLPSGHNTTYMKLQNLQGRWLKPNLRIATAFDYEKTKQDPFNSALLYYGAPISMAILALAMAHSYRRKYLIFYIAYIISMLTLLGIGSFHIPNIHPLIWPILILINALSTVLFMGSFLNLREATPQVFRLTNIMVLAFISLTLWEQVQDHEVYAFIPQVMIYILSAISAGMSLRQGVENAGILFAGWTILALSFIANTISLRYGVKLSYLFSVYGGFAVETILFTLALVLDTRKKESLAQEQNQHAIAQLAKVFYPHQIEEIRSGKDLESTMPTGEGEACVLVFDVVGSSKIQHENAKAFFEGVFQRCNTLMNEHYDPHTLTASAYRIKEMGDGFICSVGFPFRSVLSSKAEASLNLAQAFHQAFLEEVRIFAYHEPLACCIGIAMDHVSGYFPATGTKAYDLFGRGIVLATRYESMRKSLDRVESLQGKIEGSMIILQEKVYASLPPHRRSNFNAIDLLEEKLVVRDDPQAKRIYVSFLDLDKHESHSLPTSMNTKQAI